MHIRVNCKKKRKRGFCFYQTQHIQMKIAIAQQNYHIGNFEDNTRKIMGAIQYAKSRKADLVVFSELSICGYPPRDFLEFDDFINECYKAIEIITEQADTIGVIIGSPKKKPIKRG